MKFIPPGEPKLPNNDDINELAELIKGCFTEVELEELCFRLQLDYTDIKGGSRKIAINNLVSYYQRRNTIDELVNELQKQRPKVKWLGQQEAELARLEPIKIPYIILAMTRDEAEYLIRNNNKDIQNLQDKLGNQTPLLACYGMQREDWKPYPSNSEQKKTIGKIVNEVSDKIINELRQNSRSQIVKLVDLSHNFFHDNLEIRDKAWEYIIDEVKACIVFIDSVSLFHPTLIKYLQISRISDMATMIFLSPIHSRFLEINEAIENKIEKELWRLPKRFEELEMRDEVGVNDLRNLNRWLKIILPRTINVMNSNNNQ